MRDDKTVPLNPPAKTLISRLCAFHSSTLECKVRAVQDLRSSKAIWFKGVMFFLIAVAASVLLFLELPTFRVALLLTLAIWASCRAYYFAFYVIERYVDPGFRFSGLGSFIAYAIRKRSRP